MSTITNVRLYRPSLQDKPELLAYASLELAGKYVVRDLRLMLDRDEGTQFIVMPSHGEKVRCGKCGAKSRAPINFCPVCGNRVACIGPVTYHDIFHPCNRDARDELYQAVLCAFDAGRFHQAQN